MMMIMTLMVLFVEVVLFEVLFVVYFFRLLRSGVVCVLFGEGIFVECVV